MVDERTLLADALTRSMGGATLAEVRTDFEERIKAGEFVEVPKKESAPSRAFTTAEMIGYELDTINMMRAGQDKNSPLSSLSTRRGIENNCSHLSDSQRRAVEQILSSRD